MPPNPAARGWLTEDQHLVTLHSLQVEAAKREVTRAGARPADREIWETQLVALQVRRREAGLGAGSCPCAPCMFLHRSCAFVSLCSLGTTWRAVGDSWHRVLDISSSCMYSSGTVCRTRGVCTATRSTCWRWSCWGGSTGGEWGRQGCVPTAGMHCFCCHASGSACQYVRGVRHGQLHGQWTSSNQATTRHHPACSERIAAERVAAEASGAAQLQRLQEQVLQTRVKYNRAKYQVHAASGSGGG